LTSVNHLLKLKKLSTTLLDPSAMDVDELRRARRQERAERVEKLAELVGSMDAKKMEADDVSITDLIDKPKFV